MAKSMKPRIGISVCLDRGQRLRPGVDYLYLRRDYASQVALAGGMPLLLGPDLAPADACGLCDALVISGGGDLPTSLDIAVGGALTAGEPEQLERVRWDRALLDEFAGAGRPVLGVCYGMQLMNLHFGGSLYRDLRDEVGRQVPHGGGGQSAEHDIQLDSSSQLFPLTGGLVRVNSSHVQAVRDVAPGFSVTARAADGVVEAIEREQFLGVEWHPESDATGPLVYGHLVRLATRSRGE